MNILDVLPVDIDANTAVKQDIKCHLCFRMKQESTYKKNPRNPKTYQLQSGGYATVGSLYKQEDTDDSESEDSFCLQMQIMKLQADQERCHPQHLATNLHYKVKPYGKITKILRAKIDTCLNTNVMPASIYKILYNDPECIKLQPSEKKGHKVKFQVVSVEGSLIISCATSINLNLIQILNQLDTKIPDCAGLIYSSADAPSQAPIQSTTKSTQNNKF